MGDWQLANWGIVLLVAIALGAVWTWLVRNSQRKEYTLAYYWLRLLTRYWVALNILHYAYLKVYPMQKPYPLDLEPAYTGRGDSGLSLLLAIIGLSTWYQVVLGCMEAIAGNLLFFRRTVAVGALLNLGILYNVAHANFGVRRWCTSSQRGDISTSRFSTYSVRAGSVPIAGKEVKTSYQTTITRNLRFRGNGTPLPGRSI